MEPHCPVARRRNLIVLEVQEFVRGHILGEDVRTLSLEHRWEYDAVENDIVLTDEVKEARIFLLPPLFPVVGEQLFRIRNITNGSVKPNIEHLALSSLNGNRDTPIQVARYGTGAKT